MPMSEKDYLLRMIERLSEAIAAILFKRKGGQTSEALALLEQARVDLFGPMRKSLDLLDASSAATMLGSPEKIRAWARFLAIEGDLRADRGETKSALTARRRALETYRVLRSRFSAAVNDDDRATIAELEQFTST